METTPVEAILDTEIRKDDVGFVPVGQIPVIYLITTNADIHKGRIKIGKTHITEHELTEDISDNSDFLREIAWERRIKSYCNITGLKAKILFVGLRKNPYEAGYLWDHHVHDVLENSGFHSVEFEKSSAREWYEISQDVALNAIKAATEGRKSLTGNEKCEKTRTIVLREEQELAIEQTVNRFKNGGNRMLWNAKMRFGKTITALALVKKLKLKKVLLATHRPAVSSGWKDDFNLIFPDGEYVFDSKKDGVEDVKYPLENVLKLGKPFVYFISIQDLRGSLAVNDEGLEKNVDIFETKWDLIVIDEAHEGTMTGLGRSLFATLKTKYKIALSGTPFNIVSEYGEDEVFTWDYIAEQKRKREWPKYHGARPNPYIGLPEMRMYSYDLSAMISNDREEEIRTKTWFSFAEFFRVDETTGCFVHEEDVNKFLTRISTQKEWSNYPFSSIKKQQMFRHTFWLIPGVKEGRALQALMSNHEFFSQYTICNVAGESSLQSDTDGRKAREALEHVKKQIKLVEEDLAKLEEDRIVRKEGTITLSCGKLTTGVSVPEWTGVFMLSGGEEIAASLYLQTIFRVQTPYTSPRTGAMKTHAYVFDFAPDRCLRVLHESVMNNMAPGPNKPANGGETGGAIPHPAIDLTNYLALIIEKDSKLERYDAHMMMRAINRIQAEEAVRTGFCTNKLFKPDFLRKFSKEDLLKYEGIVKKIFKASSGAPQKIIEISNTTNPSKPGGKGSGTSTGRGQGTKKKPGGEPGVSPIEKAKEQLLSAFQMLLARLPLLIYASDEIFDDTFSLTAFIDRVDDLSWREFIPITKDEFKQISPIINEFAISDAGRIYRELTKQADALPPEDRVIKIAEIIARFRNPDKETVLTPWRVVNMHMSDTLGGMCFYDEQFNPMAPLEIPREVKRNNNVFRTDSKVLELNSKTGLYSLYVAFSIFSKYCDEARSKNEELTLAKQHAIWRQVVEKNLYLLCGTQMAALIAKRTLLGYSEGMSHIYTVENLSRRIAKERDKIVSKLLSAKTWKEEGFKKMKFDAVVGNPPYQVQVAKKQSSSNGQARTSSVFQHFQIVADKVSSGVTSLIYPGGRWIHRSGKGMVEFGLQQINDVTLERLDFYPNSQDIFREVAIADGISLVYKNKAKTTPGFRYVYHADGKVLEVNVDAPGEALFPLNPADGSVIDKVDAFIARHNAGYMFEKVLSQKLFGIESDFVEKNPTKVRPYNGENLKDNEIKLFTNDKAGKAGRAKWFVANRAVIEDNSKLIDQWQVVVSSANAGGQKRDWQLEVIDNHSAFGRSRVALASFETEDEARNFYRYCQCYLIRFMFLMTDEALSSLGKLVPDIMDYSSNCQLLDFKKGLNAQLYEMMELTEDEIKHVESRIKTIDFARSKNTLSDGAWRDVVV